MTEKSDGDGTKYTVQFLGNCIRPLAVHCPHNLYFLSE